MKKSKMANDDGERQILKPGLQYELKRFLEAHGARACNIRLRRAMIGYIYSTGDSTPDDFENTLWDFQELMELLDQAEADGH